MKRKGIDNGIEKISKWDKIIQEVLYLTILNLGKEQQRKINGILSQKEVFFKYIPELENTDLQI